MSMDATWGTLWMASAGLGVAAGALARAGARQRSFRGWRWWVAAVVAGALGVAALPLAGGIRAVAVLAQMLLLAWPVLALVGLRRFHGRLGLPSTERADWSVLAGCIVAVLLGAIAPQGSVTAMLLPAVASLLAHLYAAALMGSSRTAEDVGALRLLGGVIALVGFIPAGSWAIGMPGPGGWLGLHALAAFAGLQVLALVTLTLTSERTERELRDSRRRLRLLANTDPLTSVANRRHFQELAARRLRDTAVEAPVALVFDIDHFKLLNDRLGHAAGDRALRLVARCLQDTLRANDIAGRIGGDEFALLLDSVSLPQAVAVAERLVMQLQAQAAEHHLPCLTLSFGLVQVRTGENVDDALRRADQALYEAKRQGRSRAVTAAGDEDAPKFSESQRLGLTAL